MQEMDVDKNGKVISSAVDLELNTWFSSFNIP